MKLKKGDFIEDKFGQIERTILTSGTHHSETLRRLFNWFGNYLMLVNEGEGSSIPICYHMRGRSFTEKKMVLMHDDYCKAREKGRERNCGSINNCIDDNNNDEDNRGRDKGRK
jgi:hypothetical protein